MVHSLSEKVRTFPRAPKQGASRNEETSAIVPPYAFRPRARLTRKQCHPSFGRQGGKDKRD